MPVGSVDLYSSSPLTRQVVYAADKATLDEIFAQNPSLTTHTLEVRVLGTKNASSIGTRVDVDGFAVLP